jgi:hypothetical protein
LTGAAATQRKAPAKSRPLICASRTRPHPPTPPRPNPNTPHPTKVAHGLLWVYGDASAESWLTAFDSPPAAGLTEMDVGGAFELKQVGAEGGSEPIPCPKDVAGRRNS